MTEQLPESTAQQAENNNSKTAETSPIIAEKPESSLNQAVKDRKKLFQTLDVVLETSKDKFNKQKASNNDRQKWARIIIAAASAYNDLLRDVELEGIEERLSRLEREKWK
jgi:hypothetical protein